MTIPASPADCTEASGASSGPSAWSESIRDPHRGWGDRPWEPRRKPGNLSLIRGRYYQASVGPALNILSRPRTVWGFTEVVMWRDAERRLRGMPLLADCGPEQAPAAPPAARRLAVARDPRAAGPITLTPRSRVQTTTRAHDPRHRAARLATIAEGDLCCEAPGCPLAETDAAVQSIADRLGLTPRRWLETMLHGHHPDPDGTHVAFLCKAHHDAEHGRGPLA